MNAELKYMDSQGTRELALYTDSYLKPVQNVRVLAPELRSALQMRQFQDSENAPRSKAHNQAHPPDAALAAVGHVNLAVA